MDCNVITVVGRMADDPKLYDKDDESKTRVWFRVAVNRGGRKDADGNPLVDWLNVTAFGKKAVAIANHCHKGKEVSVTGELHEESKPITDNTGQRLVHPDTGKELWSNYTEILARQVSFGRDSAKHLAAQAQANGQVQQQPGAYAAPPAPAPAPAPSAYAAPPAPAPTYRAPTPQVSPELLAAVQAQVLEQLQNAQVAPAASPLGAMAG